MANYGSVTIQFGIIGGGVGRVSIELDEEMNQGKTQFAYGSKAYFQVYSDPGMSVQVVKSDGTLTTEGSGQREFVDQVVFVEEQTADLAKPISSVTGYTWFGQSLGVITKTGVYQITTAQAPDVASGKIGVADVKYKANFARYSISVPNKGVPEYPVLIVAVAS